MCISKYECARPCVWSPWRSGVNFESLALSFSTGHVWDSSVTEPGALRFGETGWPSGLLSSLPPWVLGIKTRSAMPRFLHGYQGSTSGLHTRAASTLANEPPPRSRNSLMYKCIKCVKSFVYWDRAEFSGPIFQNMQNKIQFFCAQGTLKQESNTDHLVSFFQLEFFFGADVTWKSAVDWVWSRLCALQWMYWGGEGLEKTFCSFTCY